MKRILPPLAAHSLQTQMRNQLDFDKDVSGAGRTNQLCNQDMGVLEAPWVSLAEMMCSEGRGREGG